MKTQRDLVSYPSIPIRLLILAALATIYASAANAQVTITPLPVGPDGLSPLGFNTQPGLADGWSMRSVPGGNGDIGRSAGSVDGDSSAMDAAVATNSFSMITNALVVDSDPFIPHSSNPSTG